MLIPEGENKEFLGEEFLTWLWYYGDNNEWAMQFEDEGYVQFGMDELLVMKSADLNSSQSLSGAVPIYSPEARTGLKEGKKVTKARIILESGGSEWAFTCNSETFQFSSLKLLQTSTKDPEERFLEFAYDMEQAVEVFDKMYEFFLKIRLSPEWDSKELPNIKTWMQKEREKDA